MDLQLRNQVSVIVGGASGIGKAIAEAFCLESAVAVLADRRPDTEPIADQVATRCNGTAAAIVLDATDFTAVQAAATEVVTRFGGCDHVVYAAGVGSGKFGFPFWELRPADWPRVLDVNLLGAVNVAHAFQPSLSAAAGTLTFLSSVAGQIGSQTDPPYSASKAALINFAQCAARDFAADGVRVNVLCPGMVKTTLNHGVYEAWAARQPTETRISYDEWTAEKIRKLVPLGRWQEPEDLAALAVFLASPRAKNITGQTINVDGGYVMHW